MSSLYDGVDARTLERRLALPHVAAFAEVSSTLDIAHQLAASGCPAGTLVIADRQTSGRGRGGRTWASPSGSGVWLTVIERPTSAAALEVLSLRLGLRTARALDTVARSTVQLKWPNDIYLDGGKLGGILVETRWREGEVEWVAIGLGINVRPPDDVQHARGLNTGCDRLAVLDLVVPAVRASVAAHGPLRPVELREYEWRHIAQGRRCTEPAPGVVEGVSATGALLVREGPTVRAFTSGSLVLEAIS